jgi:hypothetical protein
MHRIMRVPTGPEYVQLEVRVRYSGNVRCRVTGELTLNTPAPAFVSLPAILTLCGLDVDAMLLLVYRERKEVRVSVLHPVGNPKYVWPSASTMQPCASSESGCRSLLSSCTIVQSISKSACLCSALVDVAFDSQIGDPQQSVLRHVEQLETFLVTVLRKIVTSTVQACRCRGLNALHQERMDGC